MSRENCFNNSQSCGFSLVELMIVVAIIGMLAAVGIPQYAKFQAKARQSEAKSSLSSIYGNLRSFQYEWNWYTVDLKNAGFGVEGKNLRYVVGFGIPAVVCADGLSSFLGPPERTPAEQGVPATNTTWSRSPLVVNTAGATWHNQIPMADLVAVADATNDPAVYLAQCSQNAFKIVAIGDVRNNPNEIIFQGSANFAAFTALNPSADVWSIDHQKSLKIEKQGF